MFFFVLHYSLSIRYVCVFSHRCCHNVRSKLETVIRLENFNFKNIGSYYLDAWTKLIQQTISSYKIKSLAQLRLARVSFTNTSFFMFQLIATHLNSILQIHFKLRQKIKSLPWTNLWTKTLHLGKIKTNNNSSSNSRTLIHSFKKRKLN